MAVIHVAWNDEEKKALKPIIPRLKKGLPGKNDILQLKKTQPALHRRTWQNIKDYLRNNRSKLVAKYSGKQ